jgi:hypothetical protein
VNSKTAAGGPTPPKLTSKDLLQQFWADAYGKEVQSAATYSYMWLADQFGHVCIGPGASDARLSERCGSARRHRGLLG